MAKNKTTSHTPRPAVAAARKSGTGPWERPFFQAALQSDGTLELLVYDYIGEDFWTGEGVTVKEFKQQIDAAGNYSRILMRINSPGGDVFEGIAIYNLIRSQKRPVEVRVDGIAASSASVIAMAGDDIIMGPNAMMMIHDAWGMCVGHSGDMREMADRLEKVSGALAQTYVTRTGKPADEIAALMQAETWMTAQECLASGFATAIAESDEQIGANALALARNFKGLGRMKRVPETLKFAASAARPGATNPQASSEGDPELCECDCANCEAGSHDECTNPECDDPNCVDCPMQEDGASAAAQAPAAAATPAPASTAPAPAAPAATAAAPKPEESNLSLYQARGQMLLRRLKNVS